MLRLREQEWSMQLTRAVAVPPGGVKVRLAWQMNTSPVSEMTGQLGVTWVEVPRLVRLSEESVRTSE